MLELLFMLFIITGHLLGIIIPVFIFKDIKLIPTEFAGTAPVYLGLLVLWLFVEYQLYRSRKYGVIYFRGTIDESDEVKFNSCQFAYAVQGGAFMMVLLQNTF